MIDDRNVPTDRAPGRGRIYASIVDTIGDTPLVRLEKLARLNGVRAHLLAKLEFFNPLASVKDRIGVSMIDALEHAGKIEPGKACSSSRPPAIPGLRSRSWPPRMATV